MPNPLPGRITTFKEAVEWLVQRSDYADPKVRILVPLYQATSPLLPKGQEFSGDTDVTGGLCQGMALEWIKKNSMKGGADDFRAQARSNWSTFADSQISISHVKRCLRAVRDELDQRRRQVDKDLAKLRADEKYERETGLLARVKHYVAPPIESSELTAKALALQKLRKKIDDDYVEFDKDVDSFYANVVFQTDNAATRFAKVASAVTLADVGGEIQRDQGTHPTYYMMNLGKAQSDAGHCIAAHAAYRPRLLDANSCEFQFDSMATFYAFLADYWQIYERAGYARSTVAIYRYEIRHTKRFATAMTLARGAHAEAMAEIARRPSSA